MHGPIAARLHQLRYEVATLLWHVGRARGGQRAIVFVRNGKAYAMAMTVVHRALIGAAIMIGTSGASSPAPAPRGLAVLEPGDWVLHDRESGKDTGKDVHLCLGDTRQLLQLRHPGAQCRRFVVTDSAQAVAVTNVCGAAGNERTDIRIETPRLIQIQSQGIVNGAPFSMAIEGRRVGACR